jgi:hypothetical protein
MAPTTDNDQAAYADAKKQIQVLNAAVQSQKQLVQTLLADLTQRFAHLWPNITLIDTKQNPHE